MVLSIGQIEQTMCVNKILMLNCDCYIVILENIYLCTKKSSNSKCVYKSYIFIIYMFKEDLALNNLQ